MKQNVFKNPLHHMAAQDIFWQDRWITRGATNRLPKLLAATKQALLNDLSENLQGFGFKLGSDDYQQAMNAAGNTYAGPVCDFADDMRARASTDREYGLRLTDHGSDSIYAADFNGRSRGSNRILEDALFELQLDRASYNDCLRRHRGTR